ncbi:MAG: hypothetical protein MUF05_05570 [Candidatus Omnitrophica bacterium]|jgi:hypothetical protein|nr:hypothetical protein [Candidatus Omnitrophota bacterium]
MAKQLNIFIENRPGRLKSVSKVLSEKKINIIGFTIQDRGDFGMMKLFVDYPKQAQLALTESGFASAMKDVLAVSIKDKAGNLYKLTDVLSGHKINIVDAHGFVMQPKEKGICILEIPEKNIKDAEKIVRKAGFSVLTDVEVQELV